MPTSPPPARLPSTRSRRRPAPPCGPDSHDVFVSYAHDDKHLADALVNRLESDGIRCWVAPRDVRPGAEWAGSIIEAIHGSRLLVLVFSESTNHSDHILREVRAASDAHLPIVPLRVTEDEPSAALDDYIGGTHWLDAVGEPARQHLGELSTVVAQLLGTGVGASSPSPPASAPVEGPRARRRMPMLPRIALAGLAAASLVGLGVLLAGWDVNDSPESQAESPGTDVTGSTAPPAVDETTPDEPQPETPTSSPGDAGDAEANSFSATAPHGIAIAPSDGTFLGEWREAEDGIVLTRTYGIAVGGTDAGTVVYVGEVDRGSARLFDTTGAPAGDQWDLGFSPNGIDVDQSGDVYVTGDGAVKRYVPDGTELESWTSGLFDLPFDVAVDSAGVIWVTDQGSGVVVRFG